MNYYRCLKEQIFEIDNYKIVPIRFEDRFDIMKWRNEQIFHLRQQKTLTREDQDQYFKTTVTNLFTQERPDQILFSYLENNICIGYGGLVHINWIDKHAEISFVMKTALEEISFEIHWKRFLHLQEVVAFKELHLHKIFTYAFDLRQNLYKALLSAGYKEEARLKEHCFFNGKFIDVLIHSKIGTGIIFREVVVQDAKILYNWVNEKEVRNNSLISKPIKWEDHLAWLKNKIENINSKIFIFFNEQEPVGQVRLDLDDNYWTIDFSVSTSFRGRGYGKFILQKIIETGEFEKFKAVVKTTNIGSIKVFRKLGFEEVGKKLLDESELIEFKKEL